VLTNVESVSQPISTAKKFRKTQHNRRTAKANYERRHQRHCINGLTVQIAVLGWGRKDAPTEGGCRTESAETAEAVTFSATPQRSATNQRKNGQFEAAHHKGKTPLKHSVLKGFSHNCY
jgi:hypothetical protein